MAVCSEHPDDEALYACPACLRLLCTACFTSDPRGAKRCAHCQGEVQRVAARTGATMPPPIAAPAPAAPLPQARAIAAPPPPITARLREVFAFGVRKDMLVKYAGLAVVTTALRWIATRPALGEGGLVLFSVGLIALGLEAAFYFAIVEQRAAGDDQFEAPDLSSRGEISAQFGRYLAILLPIIGALFWFGEAASGHWWLGFALMVLDPTFIFHFTGPAALFVAGVVLWPLMTIIAAISRSSLMAYHPGNWLKTLRMLGGDYATGVVVFYAVLGVETLAVPAIARVLPLPATVVLLVMTFAGYIPMAIRARLLGELAEPYFRL